VSMTEQFIRELVEEPLSFLISKWILSRTPHVFGTDHEAYLAWKEILADKIGVDSCAITITGSAATGFSLSPHKNFRAFDDESDVDIAVVSHHYFDISWHYLRSLGALRYQLTKVQQDSILDHARRLIYWGTIATDKMLEILPFGRTWIEALTEMAAVAPTEHRGINARIYNDFESLRAYHTNNLNRIRNDVLETMSGVKPDEITLGDDT
jgi:predicted nucleotidyltransferase